ncbi:MAG: alkaline phosphatase family protein [Steroidobacteraceae bacterium]
MNHTRTGRLHALTLCLLLAAGAVFAADSGTNPAQHRLHTENVVLIVPDGLRWQEVFTGAEKALLNDKEGGSWLDDKTLLENFWREDVSERRRLLFPFLWGTVAQQGQIFGNKALGSNARVTNGMAFSYPGYNELVAGFGDPQIDSNEYGPNPNLTVFEWLNGQPDLRGRVAVYATWGAFGDIFNHKRSGLHIQAGARPPKTGKLTPRDELLNELYATTTLLDADDPYNSFVQVAMLDYVKEARPRVLFVGYGETDSWAHSGRYDLVLTAARQVDQFVEQLWNTMQSMPQYRGKTTFIVTTDHGRGSGPVDWKEHGVDSPGSEDIWIAVIGPDTPTLGERRDAPPVTQAQVAATVAAFLGRDFRKAAPRAAARLPDVISPAPREGRGTPP